ncbi:MAG TPA: preprotein translocase subunit YajC [Bacteroidales bacterium]|nr:preprotein translocase subunit YajC [Bacteroidales bacterium]HPT22700.1 preprotein translocase subunit YajC [Bacteroidales bacterium]
MTNLAFLYLMGQPAGTSGQGNALVTFLPLILVFVVFYFFMIRPQMKKQKELTNYRNSLKRGDKVITTGGIYGKIYEVKDTYATIDVGNDIKLKVDKNALIQDPSQGE